MSVAARVGFAPFEMTGKRCLVTAGASGIGAAIAAGFAANGARVAICDIDEGALDRAKAAASVELALRADVSRPDEMGALLAKVEDTLGGLDVLVNNAGIAGPTGPVQDVTDEALAATFGVNLAALFYTCRSALPMLVRSDRGAIINLSSVAGRLSFPMRTPYAASKWGVIGFTKSLAGELGGNGITVNAIMPGHVETDRFARVVAAKAEKLGITAEEMRARYLSTVALGRTVSPVDIANMALYLASPFGASITGQAISVCAGVEMMQ